MDTGMLHTHRLIVYLYVLFFLIKVIMLLVSDREKFDRFRRKTKVLDMVLPTLFLITGVYLAFTIPVEFLDWLWVKLAAMVLAIVVGIMAFKRYSKALGILTLLIFGYIIAVSHTNSATLGVNPATVITYNQDAPENKPASPSYNQVEHGKAMYTANCALCHGPNGDKGQAGAKNLRESKLTAEQAKDIILNGKNIMPAYEGKVTPEEVDALVAYIMTLRDNPAE